MTVRTTHLHVEFRKPRRARNRSSHADVTRHNRTNGYGWKQPTINRPATGTIEEHSWTSNDSVGKAIAQAVANGETINLTDDKGRHIIVPAKALGYAIIGSETKHAVGFGAL